VSYRHYSARMYDHHVTCTVMWFVLLSIEFALFGDLKSAKRVTILYNPNY